MSRSTKKPIYKDVGHQKRNYWQSIRREWRIVSHKIKRRFTNTDGLDYRQPKEIINDYDYSDYKIDFRRFENDRKIKNSRK